MKCLRQAQRGDRVGAAVCAQLLPNLSPEGAIPGMDTWQEAMEPLMEVGFKATQFSKVGKVLSAWRG